MKLGNAPRLFVGLTLVGGIAAAQGRRPQPGPDTLGLKDGYQTFSTPEFQLKLVKDSQTAAALNPVGTPDFDFTPADRLERRSANRFYQLGDLTFRVRAKGATDWKDFSSATSRKPVTVLPNADKTLSVSDLAPTLGADCPLQVTRTWLVKDGHLALSFTLKNKGTTAIELGALGIPMVFNNIISERNLKQANEICSFSDPYMGQDGGYLQVTRLSGHGPELVVAPLGRTPFEAYRLLNEPERPNQTFEGMFEWMVQSQAYADKEWKGVQQWNPTTEATIAPGLSLTYGVQFLLSPSIRQIDETLIKAKRPVAIGIPGYILPADQDGKLFVHATHGIKSMEVFPEGAMDVKKTGSAKHGWQRLEVHGKGWGRTRLTLVYDNGERQSIHYYLTKPAAQAVDDLGHFLTTKQWFDDPNDPFHRGPGVISYDREADKQVQQDSRVWIAGLGDEAGSGSWLAAGMKEFIRPNPEEIAKYEQFVDNVLWGGIQYKEGDNKYGVRKSLFFYDPKAVPNYPYNPDFNWTSWTSWNKQASEDIGRGYNYPHVVAAYWSMYRLARNHPGLVKNHPWDWYLNQALQTTLFLTSTGRDGDYRVGYVDTGLMEGDVFVSLLDDLKREGWTQQATELEARMKKRAEEWFQREYPFGSEMAWDSTGQEEIYAWCEYFNRDDKGQVALNSILGYMPTLPHWGYNGNARRYWDFLYGGKLPRIERQIHHYGSGINSLPVLSKYRQTPDDFYLLQVGYGGEMGALSNIDQEGFASAAFHTFPSTLKWDAYSGDYGPNFFGHAFATGTYIINHPDFGWQAYGGNVNVDGSVVTVEPKDDYRERVYIAPLGLWLVLDAGQFDAVEINSKTRGVRVRLAPAEPFTPAARLRIEQPAKVKGVGTYGVTEGFTLERGAFTIPLDASAKWVTLKAG